MPANEVEAVALVDAYLERATSDLEPTGKPADVWERVTSS
jgi:hypothetical protein